MSETFTNLLQWLVIAAFFLIVIGSMFAEAAWLSKKGWASFAKSFVFSALSNFVGFGIGLFVFLVVIMIFMMRALDGSLKASSSPAKDKLEVAIFIFAALLTPLLLIIGKRVFLGILKMQTGKAAWIYALVTSILIFVIALGVPIVAGYFAFA